MTENRTRKMRTESKVLEQNNRDMDQRLREIKQLFEKEQVKREKEALIWSSAGDGKRRKQQIDQQSRKILGKGHQTGAPNGAKPKFKVLKDEPIQLPDRPANRDLNKFITSQRNRIDETKRKAKSKSVKVAAAPLALSPPVPTPPLITEDYALLSDATGSEIFELPLTGQGHLSLQVVRAVSSSRTIGIYAIRDGRKRLMLSDESGLILRPSGGWSGVTFYPLVPPRSSRPPTARLDSPRSSIMMTPTPPLTPKVIDQSSLGGGDLLNGAPYDEARAAAEFKMAVQHFRQQPKPLPTTTSEVTITDENDTELDDKLTKIGEMFEARTNLSVMDRILLEKSRSEGESVTPGQMDETNEEPTEEELEMEEERQQLREMLIGSPSSEAEEEAGNEEKKWAVPTDWVQNQSPRDQTIEHQFIQRTDPSVEARSPSPDTHDDFSKEIDPMWIPTPLIVTDQSPDDEGSYYEPAGEVYQEHTRTVYDDGTVVNNIITVETNGGDDSASDGEWQHDPGEDPSTADWIGYDSDDDVELGTDSEFKREAIRIIDEHARRYQEQFGDRPDSATIRPASRTSVMTDADLEQDQDMTEMLTQMDAKYYLQDEYD